MTSYFILFTETFIIIFRGVHLIIHDYLLTQKLANLFITIVANQKHESILMVDILAYRIIEALYLCNRVMLKSNFFEIFIIKKGETATQLAFSKV